MSTLTKKQIEAFRLKRNMSQKEFAEVLGVTWQAVRFWELGERGIPVTTAKLVKLFDRHPKLLEEFKEL